MLEVQVGADLVSGENFLPDLQKAVFCMREREGIIPSLNPDYLKGCISKCLLLNIRC